MQTSLMKVLGRLGPWPLWMSTGTVMPLLHGAKKKNNIQFYLSTAFFKPITAILSSEKALHVYINKEYSSVDCLALLHYKEIPGACGSADWDRCN